MRYAATPREIVEWRRFLAPLPPGRIEPVIDMLAEALNDCPCENPVRRCDARRLAGGRLVHVDCVGGVA